MSHNETPTPIPFSDETLALLTDQVRHRARLLVERETINASLDVLNAALMTALTGHHVTRVQAPSGAIVQIVQQAPRETILKAKLVELGVSFKIIEDATVSRPVAPFIRVDMKHTDPLGVDTPAGMDTALGTDRVQ